MKYPPQFKQSKQAQSKNNHSSEALPTQLKTNAITVQQQEGATRQNQLESLANQSPRLKHLSAIQAMADRSLLQKKTATPQAPNGAILQRAVTTNGGEFDTAKYEFYTREQDDSAGQMAILAQYSGAHIELHFTPNQQQEDN
ncbi:MAG: hypothetical protein AAF985_20000, partial [Bacteroidota bacterium]